MSDFLRVLYDAVMAFFAAVGIFSLVWLTAGGLLKLQCYVREAVKTEVIVLPRREDSLHELINSQLCACGRLRVMIPEDTLTDIQRAEAVRLMEANSNILLVNLKDLAEKLAY